LLIDQQNYLIGGYIMEIGASFIFIMISLGVIFVEKTKIGAKFAVWGLKTFFDTDINEMEEE
jgi:hypothetical protein